MGPQTSRPASWTQSCGVTASVEIHSGASDISYVCVCSRALPAAQVDQRDRDVLKVNSIPRTAVTSWIETLVASNARLLVPRVLLHALPTRVGRGARLDCRGIWLSLVTPAVY